VIGANAIIRFLKLFSSFVGFEITLPSIQLVSTIAVHMADLFVVSLGCSSFTRLVDFLLPSNARAEDGKRQVFRADISLALSMRFGNW
jgi:hypothetical protein